ncbi:formylglycine-generating enzyme family protein [Parerythrobacter jejuensis]|uniref:SUMF1/EgtB/PvdO family nonheme iron enzyme n=1 Tax=Parerythrobacter jejuensis TaxID=795812 RepID=A0A845ARQ4_9SPHN|nr:SUMF1/EgtB/PvdO family nonheme iron enzyme [Parerythrobacter jejuensis]MXP31873.1 SUMF1/EgtB/PvdO family nonheme iron enzyme [Parerythrobacter jejuensis]
MRLYLLLFTILSTLSFDAPQAQELRDAEQPSPIARGEAPAASSVLGLVEKDCDECPEMRRVTLENGDSILVATHELTWREYNFSVEQSQCPLPSQVASVPSSDLPVTHISPIEFNCYLDWLNGRTQGGYRLPTAEEWRAFAKPAAQRKFPWGEELGWDNAVVFEHFDPAPLRKFNVAHSWVGGRTPSIHSFLLPVGSFAPSERGLYDIVGNVAEYTSTWEPGPPTCLRVASSQECQVAVILGGGVFDLVAEDGFMAFASKRFVNLPQDVGFRIVRNGE